SLTAPDSPCPAHLLSLPTRRSSDLAISWVRPREPWMLNRAVVQPNQAIFLGMAADIMEVAAAADSIDELFLGLEARGVLLRIDRSEEHTSELQSRENLGCGLLLEKK